MAIELKKQESLLSQIHSEMSVGSVVKHREEQLWEAQRIVTQLKRKLRHQPVNASSLSAKAEAISQTPPVETSAEPQDELRLELALPQSQPGSPPEEVEPVPITEPAKEPVDSDISESGSPTEACQHVNTIEAESQEDVTEPPMVNSMTIFLSCDIIREYNFFFYRFRKCRKRGCCVLVRYSILDVTIHNTGLFCFFLKTKPN